MEKGYSIYWFCKFSLAGIAYGKFCFSFHVHLNLLQVAVYVLGIKEIQGLLHFVFIL